MQPQTMPTLVTAQAYKDRYPDWKKQLRIDQSDTTADLEARLDVIIDDAEVQLIEYVPGVDASNITSALTRHVLIIARKGAFDVKHGDRTFGDQRVPQVIQDYEATLQMLGRYRTGEFDDPSDSKDVRMTGKRRKMDSWFRPSYYDRLP